MAAQRDRGNGLGGGFAGYGIYPDFADHHCFHMIYHDEQARLDSEAVIKKAFIIDEAEPIPRAARGRHRRPAARLALLPHAAPAQGRGHRPPHRRHRRAHRHGHQRRRGRRLRRLVGQEHGRLQGRRLPRGDRRVLPPRGVQGPHVARPQPLPHQHPRLVGRRAPVLPARLGRGPQRRALELRHQPPLPRAVRLPLRARHRHRGRRLPLRPAAAPPRPAARAGLLRARQPALERDRPHDGGGSRAGADAARGLRAGHAERPVRHRARVRRRHGGAQRPHQAAPAGGRPAGLDPHGRLRGERAARGAGRARPGVVAARGRARHRAGARRGATRPARRPRPFTAGVA